MLHLVSAMPRFAAAWAGSRPVSMAFLRNDSPDLRPSFKAQMVLPNPDPLEGRPEHGGRDRHMCCGIESVDALEGRLKAAGIEYTRSKSGRKAIFFR